MVARRSAAWLIAVGLAAAATACSTQAVDLAKSLQLVDITTGWYDAGIVGGQNKIVPSIAFKLKNAGPDIAGSIQLNAVFRRVGEGEEWGSAFVRAVDSNGLAASITTDPIVLRSTLGYTSDLPRAEILQSRFFVDAKVELFAKYGSSQWVKLGDHAIQRQLLTR